MSYIRENLNNILNEIEDACIKSNRKKEDVILIGVTKTVDSDVIEKALSCGIEHVGENKPQEIVKKYEIIGKRAKWHLIGTLQTNKVKYIIDKVDMIHSLDRISLAEEIDKRAKSINRFIDCLIQVNISKEDTKHGVYENDVIEFIKIISDKFKNIKIKGLMTMAPYSENPEDARIHFKNLKSLSSTIKDLNLDGISMDYLSMGMSNDFKVAIEEGANMVRIGTAIFGERNYRV